MLLGREATNKCQQPSIFNKVSVLRLSVSLFGGRRTVVVFTFTVPHAFEECIRGSDSKSRCVKSVFNLYELHC